MSKRTYVLEMNETQAIVVRDALELYGRIHMGQLNDCRYYIPKHRRDFIQELDDILSQASKVFTGLMHGGYFGITNREISNSARTAWDLYQVVRHKIAWINNPEGNIMSVHFDSPLKTSDEPFAKCEVLDDNVH